LAGEVAVVTGAAASLFPVRIRPQLNTSKNAELHPHYDEPGAIAR
jgi:hypothetical protein